MRREDLTEPQRRLLDRAAAEMDGCTLLWTSAETRVAKNLAEMGLGRAYISFEINDAGRMLAEVTE